jgi:hypothetical protein
MDKAECGTQPETTEKVIYAKYLAACHGRIHQEKGSSKENPDMGSESMPYATG